MRKQTIWVALWVILIVAMACTPREKHSTNPPTVIPTITVLPSILTETPRVTATLTPSETHTPSDTPSPTVTPSPVTPTATTTLTPTPPVVGRILVNSEFNANVREGPSRADAVITSASPGTQIETHGASPDQQYVFVRFINPEGQLIEGWVLTSMIEFPEGYIVPTIGPTPTLTPVGSDGDGAPSAFVTATPSGSVTPSAGGTPSPRLSDVNILAYCRTNRVTPVRPRPNQTVSIFWSWYTSRPELMEDHLNHATYEVLLDGRVLDHSNFQTQMVRESDGNWYVYWYVPVGTLSVGRHEVTYRVTWDAEVNDGYGRFGPDTNREEETGNCVFEVVG